MSTFLDTPLAARRETAFHSLAPDRADGSFRLAVIRPTPTTAVIEVAGELDVATAPRLAHLLGPRLASALRTVVIDLSAVTSLDAAGLSVLAHAHHQAAITGRALKLITGPDRVNRLLVNSGLETVLAWHAPDQHGFTALAGQKTGA
ncbi:STAS domain-containing protein [Amycolatopsis sp. NPDC102389]|uniref:STAS domain-containing protein n=1 Tax=Amycolatopsis sp. NPDC102389 TaxID=3363941 RepID=UPI00380B5DD7